jgi:hypothetical protein
MNGTLFFIAFCVAMLLGEAVSRLFLNPVDFLVPKLAEDEILGRKVLPYSAGHDGWGFRNRSVPDSVDIVCIGDSQTYGVSAPAKFSWPETLGKLLNKSVYNLGLGGYNPLQYDYLLAWCF